MGEEISWDGWNGHGTPGIFLGRLGFNGIAGLNIQEMTGGWNIHGMAGLIFMGRLEFHGIAELNIQGMTGGWNIHGMAGLIFMGRLEAGKFMGWLD